MRRLVRVLGLSAIVFPVAVVAIDVVRGAPVLGLSVTYAAASSVFVAVGWLIIERRPGNVIGALLLTFGTLFALYLPADAYIRYIPDGDVAVYAALYIGLLDLPSWMLIALVALLFPDGRLPGRRWRAVLLADLVIVAIGLTGAGLHAGSFPNTPAYTNPLGVPGFPGSALLNAAYVGMLGAVVLSAASLIGRWRRADPATRAQLKWVAAGASAFAATAIATVASFATSGDLTPIAAVISAVGITIFPTSVGIAILRYRLYDIDRIVSHTVSWAAVTAMVVGIYLAGVLVLQGVLSGVTQGETLAVAGSTLVAAAAFQPLHRRIQQLVDRRFYRARYDAEGTTRAFAERLRSEIDPTSIAGALETAAAAATSPRTVRLWVRTNIR
jgi:hypothetical protein